MTGKILVTGALGNVGAEIVKRLQAAGSPFRAADLSVEKVQERFGDSVEAVAFDFSKKETYRAAFEGIETMFLMRPPQISDVKGVMLPALDAAQAAGVQHVVFLSLIGIEKAKFVPHYKVEEYLVNSPMAWTFLRASFFMQNLNTTHRLEIKEHDEIFVPVGKARTSFIDVRDIAAVAAIALSQPGHENKAYELTGAEALDYWQAARVLSEALGLPPSSTVTWPRRASAAVKHESGLRRVHIRRPVLREKGRAGCPCRQCSLSEIRKHPLAGGCEVGFDG